MTNTVIRLLARKQELVERLDQNPNANKRADMVRMLARFDIALNLIDGPGDPP